MLYITHRITPACKLYFLNNLRGIALYYKYTKVLIFRTYAQKK